MRWVWSGYAKTNVGRWLEGYYKNTGEQTMLIWTRWQKCRWWEGIAVQVHLEDWAFNSGWQIGGRYEKEKLRMTPMFLPWANGRLEEMTEDLGVNHECHSGDIKFKITLLDIHWKPRHSVVYPLWMWIGSVAIVLNLGSKKLKSSMTSIILNQLY